jgi:arylsulfatase A-like enzyme
VWSANADLVRGGGRVNDTIINSTDLYPTLASYARAPLPAGVPLDGTDLKPAFSKGKHLNRTHFHHLPGYVRFGGELESSPFSSIREGRWKLYHNYTDGSFELYDLATGWSHGWTRRMRRWRPCGPAGAGPAGLHRRDVRRR